MARALGLIGRIDQAGDVDRGANLSERDFVTLVYIVGDFGVRI